MIDSDEVNCLSCMYNHIANSTNIPLKIPFYFDKTLRKSLGIYSPDTKWILKGENVSPVMKCYRTGGIQVLQITRNGKKEDVPLDTEFDSISKMVFNPKIKDVPMIDKGRCHEDEGGGWYSKPKVKEVFGKLFAHITCYGNCGRKIHLEHKP